MDIEFWERSEARNRIAGELCQSFRHRSFGRDVDGLVQKECSSQTEPRECRFDTSRQEDRRGASQLDALLDAQMSRLLSALKVWDAASAIRGVKDGVPGVTVGQPLNHVVELSQELRRSISSLIADAQRQDMETLSSVQATVKDPEAQLTSGFAGEACAMPTLSVSRACSASLQKTASHPQLGCVPQQCSMASRNCGISPTASTVSIGASGLTVLETSGLSLQQNSLTSFANADRLSLASQTGASSPLAAATPPTDNLRVSSDLGNKHRRELALVDPTRPTDAGGTTGAADWHHAQNSAGHVATSALPTVHSVPVLMLGPPRSPAPLGSSKFPAPLSCASTADAWSQPSLHTSAQAANDLQMDPSTRSTIHLMAPSRAAGAEPRLSSHAWSFASSPISALGALDLSGQTDSAYMAEQQRLRVDGSMVLRQVFQDSVEQRQSYSMAERALSHQKAPVSMEQQQCYSVDERESPCQVLQYSAEQCLSAEEGGLARQADMADQAFLPFLPPAWRADVEQPAGVKDMGGWTASVYTAEQQHRLGISEGGDPVQVLHQQAGSRAATPRREIRAGSKSGSGVAGVVHKVTAKALREYRHNHRGSWEMEAMNFDMSRLSVGPPPQEALGPLGSVCRSGSPRQSLTLWSSSPLS